MIKPGTLCWLVNLPPDQQRLSGRVVTVTGVAAEFTRAYVLGTGNALVWYCIVADFLTGDLVAPECCLKPLHDPDQPADPVSKDLTRPKESVV